MKRISCFLLLVIFAAVFFFLFGMVRSTASGPGQVTAVGRALPSSLPSIRSVASKQESAAEIAPAAWQQIQALLEEKETRTAVQQKIDSQLLYAIKMRRGESIAKGVQSLSVDVGADDAGLVTVDITALIDDQLLDSLRGMGVEVSSVFRQYDTMRAIVSLDQIETVASFSQVSFIQPKQEALFSQAQVATRTPGYAQRRHSIPSGLPAREARYWDLNDRAARIRAAIQPALTSAPPPNQPLGIGSVTSQGDTTHRVFAARGTFNVDGTGIKIGVLSDGVDSLAVSQATGDLGAVTILPGQGGFGDEGTAMLEIIHDLAPGAQLYFATAGDGLASFAENIRDLRTAGCDIILDDVGYFVESPFQDGQTSTVLSTNNAGLATQAVNDVVASGALYFSAAANSGNLNDGTSGTWEGDFADGGTLDLVPGGKIHDFNPGTAVSQYDTITASGFLVNLHWSDPLGASNNDYDLFVLTDTGGAVVASSTNIQSGTQDPYEAIFFAPIGYRVVILQKTGAANRFLHLATNRGELAFSTPGETHGHNAASGGYGVAAVCAVCVFPSAFSAADEVETFSSDGPRQIFYTGDGSPITPGNFSSTGGSVLQQPLITAADGTAVSGAGGFPTLFYGTSAAAPHAAAIAALLKSANLALTPAQIKTALTSTAIDIEGPGTDRDSGAGIVMPFPALQSLGPPVVGKAFLELSTVSKAETCCNGDSFIDPGERGTLSVNLKNVGLMDATTATATLTTSTVGVTIINGASAYPNLAASTGSAVNTTPFSFSLDPGLSPDPEVEFSLTINYAGGYQTSQSWSFSVQLGHQLISNGSFETGDFSGWNVSTVATGGSGSPFEPWSVTPAGGGGYDFYQILTTSPQHGTHDAWNGFDGGGPMEFRMYQDISIPSGVSVNLSWRDRAQWNFCCGQTKPRTYNVQLRDPLTNAILTTLYSFSTDTVDGYHDTGWLTHSHDISAFAGHAVRIFFLESIPENFTGPGQIEFDSITSSNGPPPTPTPTPIPEPIVTQLYGATRSGQLLTVDLSTGAGTLVGSLPTTLIGGLLISGSTEIEFSNTTRRGFTQFPDGSFTGQEFDISTGAALGGPLADGGSFTGLEWVGSSLYGTRITGPGGASELRTLDPATGISSLVGATGVINPIAGLAYDETGAVMYGITGGAFGGSSSLVTLNLTTGVATVIGSVGFNGGSLEFGQDGNLYAGSVGNTGNLYRINKATGVGTLVGATGFTNITGLALVIAPVIQPNMVQFNAATANVSETLDATTRVDLVVTRTGTTTSEATVDYFSSDGTASERSDYLAAVGTLRFAANETSKTITAFIVDDRFGEGPETFNINLVNPVGCTLGAPATVAVTINSNEAVNGLNPVTEPSFNTDFFVRQHYIDFLNREADPSGLAFWKNQIDECLTSECRELRKINVSAAFFLSIEFQETGYLVYKANQAAFNSHEFLRLRDFFPDTQELGRGVVIGQPGADARLEANKQKFFLDFVQRAKFRNAAAFPTSMPAEQFVDKLNANTFDPRASVSGGVLTSDERNALITQLSANPSSPTLRAQVLRSISENGLFNSRQFNKAFVLMQYFGYLRRNPFDPPEPNLNFDGYNFWLGKLNQFNGNFVNADMVKAFIVSGEYRQRFGP
jgi:hypothetical protein